MQISALVLSGLAASASAATFFVDNKCNFPLYLQSRQGSASRGVSTPPANRNDVFSVTIPGPQVSQSSISISRQPTLSNPLQAVYNQGGNPVRTYYDLSTIYGDPLRGQGFELLSGSAGGGYSISCPPRINGDCPNTYSPSNPSGQNAVFNQDTRGNLILQLCSSNGNSS